MESRENTAVAPEPTVDVDRLAEDLVQLEVAHPGIVKRLRAAASREIMADELRPIINPLVDGHLNAKPRTIRKGLTTKPVN